MIGVKRPYQSHGIRCITGLARFSSISFLIYECIAESDAREKRGTRVEILKCQVKVKAASPLNSDYCRYDQLRINRRSSHYHCGEDSFRVFTNETSLGPPSKIRTRDNWNNARFDETTNAIGSINVRGNPMPAF